MNKNEIYKAGRNDAAESYKRRYEELADREKAMIEKQEQQNETNHKIQQQLIENEEHMDKDLDKIYQILGEERVAGTSGDAIIDENSSNLITTYTNGALNKYNSFSNLEAIEFDTQVVDAVATFLTTAVEKDMNKKFHNSLSVLEQNGIISQEKFEQHKNSVVMAKQVAGLGVYAAFSLAPIICNSISNYLKKSDIIDFIVGVYAYINRELSPIIKSDIQQLLNQLGIKVSEKKVQSIFSKYCTDNGISKLPVFSRRNVTAFGKDGMDVLAKEIVSRCDLHNKETNSRSMEFIEDFLRIDRLSAERLLKDSEYSQNSLSDVIWFSAMNYRYVFIDFIKDIDNAKRFATYDMNNDPYHSIREKRRQKMENIVNDVSTQKGLFLTKGKRKDIIDSSAKLVKYSLNPRYDVARDIKMIKREKEVLELYGL